MNKQHCPNCSSTFFETERKMKKTSPPKNSKKQHPFYKGPLVSYGYVFLEHKCNNCQTTWEEKNILT
jgi:hypothetical protein